MIASKNPPGSENLHSHYEHYTKSQLEEGTFLVWETNYTPEGSVLFNWSVVDRFGVKLNPGNFRAINSDDFNMSVDKVVEREYEFSLMKLSLY